MYIMNISLMSVHLIGIQTVATNIEKTIILNETVYQEIIWNQSLALT